MKIFVVNPLTSGHNETYTLAFAKAFRDLNHRVITLYPDPDRLFRAGESPGTVLHLPELTQAVTSSPAEWQIHPILKRWSQVTRTIRNADQTIDRDDVFFFVWLDSYLYRSLSWRSSFAPWDSRLFRALHRLRFPHQWAGLYISPKFLRSASRTPRMSRSYHPDLLFNSPGCRGILLLDEGAVPRLQARQPTARLWAAPDFCDSSTRATPAPLAEDVGRFAAGRPLVGLFGSLEKRKGVLTLLDWAAAMQNQHMAFALIGKIKESSFTPAELQRIRSSATTMAPNLFTRFQRIDDEPQFNALIQKCAIVFLAYHGFRHSSNLLTKAATFNKPVIAADEHCIGERVRAYHLGLTVRADNLAEGPALLASLLNESEADRITRQAGSARYLAEHSLEKLKTVLSQLLNKSP